MRRHIGDDDDCCSGGGYKVEISASRAPMKSPVALKIIALVVTLFSTISICFECLNLIQNKGGTVAVEPASRSCGKPPAITSHGDCLHYPRPRTYDREECRCTPVRYFVIISTQRSGSGWFESLLNSHPNISSHGEVFGSEERRSSMASIIRTLDRLYNLDWNSSASKNHCTAAVGLKWMLNQGVAANLHSLSDYFRRRRVSLIFLFRRNLLRQLVSQMANDQDRILKQLNGTHRAHVHSKDEAEALAMYKPSLRSATLGSDLNRADERITAAVSILKAARHMTIYYEDLVVDRARVSSDVQAFLGVPEQRLVSRHVKIHTMPLRDQIKNWDEVRDALNSTRFRSFLDADY